MRRKVGLEQLRRELAYDRREQVIAQYARIRKGRVVRCGVSPSDPDGPSDGKVIYDSREQAEAAALALRALLGGQQWAYECERSRHGHHHLTSKRPPR